ncbi:UPF0496 protein At3g28270-like [Cornus florida]|uniref:UPF0496 protein At3g28270-like n=1 Tax=Cornus florida TaxID=4283 RepID=UPI002898A903|nr:UPF0496 protein At3g28270-like [Cornus florida]
MGQILDKTKKLALDSDVKVQHGLTSYKAAVKDEYDIGEFDAVVDSFSISDDGKVPTLSMESLKAFTDYYMKKNKHIIESKNNILKNNVLSRVVKDENSSLVLQLCTTLKNCIIQLETAKHKLTVALNHFEREHSESRMEGVDQKYPRTLKALENFNAIGIIMDHVSRLRSLMTTLLEHAMDGDALDYEVNLKATVTNIREKVQDFSGGYSIVEESNWRLSQCHIDGQK